MIIFHLCVGVQQYKMCIIWSRTHAMILPFIKTVKRWTPMIANERGGIGLNKYNILSDILYFII